MPSSSITFEQSILNSMANFANSWILKYVEQNYISIIIFLILLFLIWYIGVLIKNWVWKMDKIADSLERIADGIDFLIDEKDKKSDEPSFTETPVEIIKPLITEVVDNTPNKTENNNNN